MSQREREIAEHEYYEKICRLERWQTLSKMFDRMSAELSTMLTASTESANTYGADEGYMVRCREERKLLNIILDGVTELRDSAVHEGVKRYTTEKPVKPRWLP